VADLPGYHFRDDGMAWWDTLGLYCSEFIAIHYTTDAMVVEDSELQNMIQEVRAGGCLLAFNQP